MTATPQLHTLMIGHLGQVKQKTQGFSLDSLVEGKRQVVTGMFVFEDEESKG